MAKSILGVVLGFLVWSFLWLGGNQLFVAISPDNFRFDGDAMPAATTLAILIVYSVCCSVAAGASARTTARSSVRVPWILGVVLLAVGIGVEAAYWDKLPVWYHLIFLVLLVPATVLGSRLVDRSG